MIYGAVNSWTAASSGKVTDEVEKRDLGLIEILCRNFLKGSKKTTKTPSQYIWRPSRDLNRELTEYKSRLTVTSDRSMYSPSASISNDDM